MSENGKSITAEREKSALRREIGVLRQTVWVLSLKLEGFSNATIAETVEIPENTVRQILERKQGDVVTLIEVATEIALHKDETKS